MHLVTQPIRLAALLALATSTLAQAAPLVLISNLDYSQLNGTAYAGTSSANSPLYQQFVVTQTLSVSSITGMVGLVEAGVDPSKTFMSIRNDSGANTFGSVVVNGASLAAPSLSTSGFPNVGVNFAFATAPVLTAGTYWLELESNQGGSLRTRWLQQKSTTDVFNVVTTGGSVVERNYFFGAYNTSGKAFGFAINGNLVSAVPEPQSMALVLAGVALLGFSAQRRRQV